MRKWDSRTEINKWTNKWAKWIWHKTVALKEEVCFNFHQWTKSNKTSKLTQLDLEPTECQFFLNLVRFYRTQHKINSNQNQCQHKDLTDNSKIMEMQVFLNNSKMDSIRIIETLDKTVETINSKIQHSKWANNNKMVSKTVRLNSSSSNSNNFNKCRITTNLIKIKTEMLMLMVINRQMVINNSSRVHRKKSQSKTVMQGIEGSRCQVWDL